MRTRGPQNDLHAARTFSRHREAFETESTDTPPNEGCRIICETIPHGGAQFFNEKNSIACLGNVIHKKLTGDADGVHLNQYSLTRAETERFERLQAVLFRKLCGTIRLGAYQLTRSRLPRGAVRRSGPRAGHFEGLVSSHKSCDMPKNDILKVVLLGQVLPGRSLFGSVGNAHYGHVHTCGAEAYMVA